METENERGGLDLGRIVKKLPLAFIAQSIVWLCAVFTTYYSMKAEIRDAIRQSTENTVEISRTKAELLDARMDLRTVNTKLDILMSNYERDMNRYIRDARDRR